MSVKERLGATLARNLPVRLGSPQSSPESWWEELLKMGKEYLLESERIKAQRAVAEAEAAAEAAKTAELPPPEKTWLEKNWWVIPGGLVVVVLLTVAAVK